MLKAQIHYFLKAVEDRKELFARDLEPFVETCETTFPEMHLQFSVFRDLPDQAIDKRLQELMPRGVIPLSELDQAKTQVEELRRAEAAVREEADRWDRVQGFVSGAGLGGMRIIV